MKVAFYYTQTQHKLFQGAKVKNPILRKLFVVALTLWMLRDFLRLEE